MKTSIGDVLAEYKEFPEKGSTPTVLTLTERNGFVPQAQRFHKRLATEDTSKYKVVRRNDIAFNPYLLWAGAVAQNTVVDEGIISPLYPTFRVREGYDPQYIARFLLSGQMIAAYDTIAFGSVPRRRRSSVADFLELAILTPPSLAEQRRIAAILAQTDLLRINCEKVIHRLNDLNRSIYFQMFGDPSRTTRELHTLGDICEVITGNTPSRSDSTNYGDEIEWIKSDNLGGTIATNAEERLSSAGRRKARTAPAGSVLVTCIAGSPTSIGKASLIDREVAFNQQINAAVPGPEIDGRFLLEQLKVAPSLVRQQSTRGMKGLVSKTNFMSIQVQLPSLDRQREFVKVAEHIDALREQRSSALAADNELMESLQYRAFAGQL